MRELLNEDLDELIALEEEEAGEEEDDFVIFERAGQEDVEEEQAKKEQEKETIETPLKFTSQPPIGRIKEKRRNKRSVFRLNHRKPRASGRDVVKQR